MKNGGARALIKNIGKTALLVIFHNGFARLIFQLILFISSIYITKILQNPDRILATPQQ